MAGQAQFLPVLLIGESLDRDASDLDLALSLFGYVGMPHSSFQGVAGYTAYFAIYQCDTCVEC